jgi:hypothetical protein
VKSRFGYLAVLAGWLVALPAPAVAHHGDAGRYDEAPYTLTGTVESLRLVNPHSIITLDVPDANGNIVKWQAELGSPQQLMKDAGWTRTTVKAGDKLTLIGRRARSGDPYLNMTERANIVMTDTGKEIFRTANFGQAPPVPAK